MRLAIMTMSAALVAAATMTAGVGPAAASDFPYCLQGRDTGIPGDCSFRTRAECMASASGRQASCNVNPRVAFRRAHRHRHHQG